MGAAGPLKTSAELIHAAKISRGIERGRMRGHLTKVWLC